MEIYTPGGRYQDELGETKQASGHPEMINSKENKRENVSKMFCILKKRMLTLTNEGC